MISRSCVLPNKEVVIKEQLEYGGLTEKEIVPSVSIFLLNLMVPIF